jgi:mRNA-degrading endonuclease RelE of RelBE toxin-antitoxin system
MDDGLTKLIRSRLDDVDQSAISHIAPESFVHQLTELWDARMVIREQPFRAAPAQKRPPPWYVGMSADFSKDVSKIDRKLQGRILEALVVITENPVELKGDTVKPLTGELKGCWRYRIADHRLIYAPDRESGNITLIAFASRGSAYPD